MGFRLVEILKGSCSGSTELVKNPEHYGGAGGELLVIAMIISWLLTWLFNTETIHNNPLKDRVGYNNLCVGWDEPPARLVAAPIFALTVYFNIRFMVLSNLREHITQTATAFQKNVFLICAYLNILSWALSSLIFVIRPTAGLHNPLWHTASFVQLVVCQFVVYVANFISTDEKYHPKGSYVFIAIFGVISFGFGALAMTQMLTFDLKKFQEMMAGQPGTAMRLEAAKAARGPVPWWLMATFDYLWFASMGLQGIFRPRAPSIRSDNTLASDDDFSREEVEEQSGEAEEESEDKGFLE